MAMVVAMAEEKDWRFGVFFFSCCGLVVVLVVVVAVAVADGRGGWYCGFFLVLDILFYCSGYNILL